jgi:hypothetical protein
VKLVEKYCPQRQTCSGSDCMENHARLERIHGAGDKWS